MRDSPSSVSRWSVEARAGVDLCVERDGGVVGRLAVRSAAVARRATGGSCCSASATATRGPTRGGRSCWSAQRSGPPCCLASATAMWWRRSCWSCPPAAAPGHTVAAPPVAALVAGSSVTVSPPVAEPSVAESSAVLQDEDPVEPTLQVAEEDSITDASDNKRPPPRPRFDLRAALAKCKPHPTTRLPRPALPQRDAPARRPPGSDRDRWRHDAPRRRALAADLIKTESRPSKVRGAAQRNRRDSNPR